MVNQDKITVQLSVLYSARKFETLIQGLNGCFRMDYMRTFLDSEPPYYGDVIRRVKKLYGNEQGKLDDESYYTVYAEVDTIEREDQYGSGYGEVHSNYGYYCIGDVLEVVKHEINIKENEQ